MSLAVNYRRWIYAGFAPYLGREIADVGAGLGDFSALLVGRDTRLTIFEPDRVLFKAVSTRFSGDPTVTAVPTVLQVDSSTLYGYFDTLVYINVLEHIQDDFAEMAHAHDALAPGGHLLIAVPAMPCLYGDLDRKLGHHRRYQRGDLLRLATCAGFEVVKIRHFDFLGAVIWYVAFSLFKLPFTGGKVGLYDKVVVPVLRRLEAIVSPPFGKNLMVILRKP